jgi:hypothetical protein
MSGNNDETLEKNLDPTILYSPPLIKQGKI